MKEEEVVNIREEEERRMEYRPQETAYLESTIGVPDQQQSRSLVPDTRYPATSMASDDVLFNIIWIQVTFEIFTQCHKTLSKSQLHDQYNSEHTLVSLESIQRLTREHSLY